jgi:hypothetical protein
MALRLPSNPLSALVKSAQQAAQNVELLLGFGNPQRELLARLAAAGEALSGPDSTVSILVLDNDGLLRNGASPNLPSDYLNAIDRLRPDPRVGTCAAAKQLGRCSRPMSRTRGLQKDLAK